ncbi:MAG TPA: S41 family peptidase [Candidatus Limnocylindrales bacterium]|nr:S41 family peptidase [Candidatus Limnocylindrales bacterium]
MALLAPWYGPMLRASSASTPASTPDDLETDMKSVASAFAVVEQNFADPVDSEKAFYQGAIPGMLRTLDPHSNFVDPAEYREMQRKQRAAYCGVGMEIYPDGNKVAAMRPFVGAPAYKADLRRGDHIIAVDGKNAVGLGSGPGVLVDSAKVADMLRGPCGTQVRVTMEREGSPNVNVSVTRGQIETSIVDAFWVKPGIAFLRVDSFEAQNIARDVEADMKKLGEENVQGMVLDLRNNPGGLVTEAVRLAGRFLRDGQIVVSHRGRAEQEQVFRAQAVPAAQKYPIVVLVNGSSASAAEIVTGALQDHDRAWVLGDTTFGKGLVQAQFPLNEGAALLLTIAHYYTPSGRLIQRDYSHQSFWDYYTHHGDNNNTQDIKATDSGRKVFGGGGITPDEKYPNPKYDIFERRTAPVSMVVYHFADNYFAGQKPSLPAGWQPDDNTLERFKAFLKKENVPFTDEEFNANKDWVRDQIRYEFYFRVWDKPAADRAQWQNDPEVKKAIESMPKAQELLQNVQKVMAQRGVKG